MPAHSTDPPARPADSTAALAVDLHRVPGIRRLAIDYTQHFTRVAPFFAGDPTSRAAWADTIARVGARPRDRAALAGILAAQQRRRGAPAAAIDAAGRLSHANTVAIVTGQQPGLFGGPLYTLFKAITAIQLAEQITRDHGVQAVPIFWVDAEDHDWDEVRGCSVFDELAATATIALPASHSPGDVPVARLALDESATRALDELESTLPHTEFREQLCADLRAVYMPGTGVADAFARWMERVLGPRGLVVFDASDTAAKPMVAPIFLRELERGDTSRLAAQAGAELVARGYHAQVEPSAGAVALFRLNGTRQAIRRANGDWLAGDERCAPDALRADAVRRPATFSPNVLLRPIVQDAIFPTAAYVPGPNELAYLAQLRSVYEHFDVPMPLFYPRATATILDRAALKFLSRHELPLDTLQPQDEAALNGLLARAMPPEVEGAFDEAGQTIDARLMRLIEVLPAIDPTLEGTARTTVKRMQQDLQTLHTKTIQAAKKRDDTLRRQYGRTRSLAFPNGQPQERTIGFVSFLNQYGPALVDRLFDALPLDPRHHWIVTI